jgi:hypothetical protein
MMRFFTERSGSPKSEFSVGFFVWIFFLYFNISEMLLNLVNTFFFNFLTITYLPKYSVTVI